MNCHTTVELINRLRTAGFSQSEIARRTGIPQPRISRWSAGHAPDSADDALKLLKLADSCCPVVPAGVVAPCGGDVQLGSGKDGR